MDITLDITLHCNTLYGNGMTGFAGRTNTQIDNQPILNINILLSTFDELTLNLYCLNSN